MSDAVISLENIRRSFGQPNAEISVLDGVTFRIEPGEFVALVGPSGSGKTTLLQIAGLLGQPDSGRIHIDGQACETLNDKARTRLRREKIGFIYQFHHLLPELSATENVAMPQWIKGEGKTEALAESKRLLALVGLGHRESHRPAELSGGEQQRVAIARALANRPRLVLADEPTGNLDPETGEQVFAVLRESMAERGAAALIVTHNTELAERCDRILRLGHGRIG